MASNYEIRIQKINEDRLQLLNMIKENITNNNVSLSNSLDSIISTLNVNEMNTRKYKAILRAKQLVFELTEQIASANSIEEIINIRKKINYYINKIKKELIERKIDEELFNTMHSNVEYLRTDIARYIRFLKRKPKLDEISIFYKDIDKLSPEDIREFKKTLSAEAKYNKRNFSSINKYPLPTRNKKSIIKEEDPNQRQVVIDPLENLNVSVKKNLSFSFDNLLENQIKRFNSMYIFSEIQSYDRKLTSNIATFFVNLPMYKKNYSIIKNAKSDYNRYGCPHLPEFIEYHKKRNSILLALEMIFLGSDLSKREKECLFDHNKCMDWILEFYVQQKQKRTLGHRILAKTHIAYR